MDQADYKEASDSIIKRYLDIRNCLDIKSIERLYLAAKGHRRAIFDFENKKNNWLVP